MFQSDKLPGMSSSTRQVLSKVRRMVPPMMDKFHKGQLGRVAVMGGSEDYTGAPYFSAMASARLGCDMSHVICTPGAAAVIKTYSPNLMVHPLMRQTPETSASASAAAASDAGREGGNLADEIAQKIVDSMLSRIHVLVVGPGLGRDPLMLDTAARVVRAARQQGVAVVMDADALAIVGRDPGVVRGYEAAVLTPNVVEFGRLCKSLGVDADREAESESQAVEKLASRLEGVTIIQKGREDVISNGKRTLVSDLRGGKKRSGGQGDTLTGSVATLLAWRKAYMDKLWEDEGAKDDDGQRLTGGEMVGLAAFGGSVITRECSRLAFEKKGRSMQASDLTNEVHTAFMTFFGDVDGGDGPGL